MKYDFKGMQIINGFDRGARCRNCGADLTILSCFKYAGLSVDLPKFRMEQNACSQCAKQFWFRYNIFDRYHHIQECVFSGDVNDETVQWESAWTKEQQENIQRHLNNCAECRQKLDQVLLDDALIGSLIHNPDTLKQAC